MVKTYLLLAFRQLAGRRMHSFINITGLSTSLAICLMLWSYVWFENSFNSFYPKAEQTYLLQTSLYSLELGPFTGHGLAPAIRETTPQIRQIVRTHWSESLLTVKSARADVKPQNVSSILFVDPEFFDIFPIESIAGDVATSLQKPYSMVLTREIAARYYSKPEDALGQTIEVKSDWFTADFTVTAVVEDPPANTTIGFKGLLSIDPLLRSAEYRNNPDFDNFFNFVELEDPSSLVQASGVLNAFAQRYQQERSLAYRPEIFLQPITEVHLSNRNPRQGRDMETIYLFITISLLVLAIAWVNYINLSTARSLERAREVGVRKTIGVLQRQLVVQFLVEAFVMNIVSVMVAMTLAGLFIPVLRELTGKPIPLQFTEVPAILTITGLVLIGTLVSGAYPAFMLSSFKPADVIKGSKFESVNGFSLRKVLIVFQFCASLILLVGTTTIITQLDFMQQQDKGVDTNQVLVIYGPDDVYDNLDERTRSFKNKLKSMANVEAVATSSVVPGGSYNYELHLDIEGHPGQTTAGENVMVIFSDMDFIQAYNMSVFEGRTWNMQRASDKKGVLINEASIVPFGLKTAKDALNERVVVFGDTLQIIGVVKNFYWESLKVTHRPIIMWPIEDIYSRRISVRIKGDVHETVAAIEAAYKDHYPESPFEYAFAEDYYNRMYLVDKQFAQTFLIFSLFAMGIACLGLFGLTLFTTQQRSREISIRKVLGASISSIMALLGSQFGRLFLTSILISIPVSWLLISRWLEGYPVRMGISIWLFAVPALILAAIATASVVVQVYRAASKNPAGVLRA